MDAARAAGHRTGENPARWRGHLDKLLAKRDKKSRGHHAAMPYDDVPAFVRSLREQQGFGPLALEFTILTAARSNEALGMRWAEIDTEKKVWTVPVDRMKVGLKHQVPLSPRALEILAEAAKFRIGEFVFPGRKPNRALSNMVFLMLLRRMGRDLTAHGFRSSFRDWAGDKTTFPREVAEAALAHAIGDETEQAYRRSDALEKRRTLALGEGSDRRRASARNARAADPAPAKAGEVTPPPSAPLIVPLLVSVVTVPELAIPAPPAPPGKAEPPLAPLIVALFALVSVPIVAPLEFVTPAPPAPPKLAPDPPYPPPIEPPLVSVVIVPEFAIPAPPAPPARVEPPCPPLIVPLLVSVVIVPEFAIPEAACADRAGRIAAAPHAAGDRPAVGERPDPPGVRNARAARAAAEEAAAAAPAEDHSAVGKGRDRAGIRHAGTARPADGGRAVAAAPAADRSAVDQRGDRARIRIRNPRAARAAGEAEAAKAAA